jgi:FG-GAP repeat
LAKDALSGLAVGDLNNDGRLDVLIANNGAAPLLLKNQSGEANNWLGLKLVGTQGGICCFPSCRSKPYQPHLFGRR